MRSCRLKSIGHHHSRLAGERDLWWILGELRLRFAIEYHDCLSVSDPAEREKGDVRTIYFDCFSGISGDMTIGALLDLGLDFDYLRTELGKLGLDGEFNLRRSSVVRANIGAVKFDVDLPGHTHNGHTHAHGHDAAHGHDHGNESGGVTQSHFHQKASEIIAMISGSALPVGARNRAVSIFERLAVAEGRVHRMPPEDVEFHEVGAIDSIVDVVGAAVGFDALGVEHFLCSAVNVGGGFIYCQHGIYPVPAPATANLLTGLPIYSKHADVELVTPTGAAILAATVDRFAPLDGFVIESVGYGAGTRSFDAFPNCLRLMMGTEAHSVIREHDEDIVVIEANIDDMSAQDLAYANERLLSAGALDVVTIPVVMKKGRPGHVLQLLVEPGDEEDLCRIVFEETTTIGIRTRPMSRRVLERDVVEVDTVHGTIRVKVAQFDGRVVNVSPEYEDCARIARETGQPLRRVREEALKNYSNADGIVKPIH